MKIRETRFNIINIVLTGICGILLFTSIDSAASSITAIATGNWSANSTWSCNCQPTSSDNITIPAGITITASGPIILFLGPAITISISGTLVLNNGASLQVDGTDLISIKAGGKISATGVFSGSVYSGVIPIFISSGSSVTGPKNITNGTLPITLLFFSGKVSGKNVLLSWASASEKNFDFYAVDRSTDGERFETIGRIQGAGNFIGRSDYHFTDSYPIAGTSYYRLRATDVDGTVVNFNVIMISLDVDRPTIEIFPNPVTGNLLNARMNFLPGIESRASLYDSHGNEIISTSLPEDDASWSMSLPTGIGKGIYFLMIRTSMENIKTRIVIE